MTREEELLTALINGDDVSGWVCRSRLEEYLVKCCCGETCDSMTPKTRVEVLLKQLASKIAEGGSGGEDMLQARVDTNNSCAYLMYKYERSDVSFLSNLETKNVTSMASMFQDCGNLTTVPLFNTSNVTNMTSLFSGCRNLTTVPLFDTSKVYYMKTMFYNCSKLTTVPAFNVSNVTNMQNMFISCYKLKSILMYGMKVAFNISDSTQFEREDLVTILNNLGTVTTATTLTMGSTNLAKLTDEDKAIATEKGWTLA